MAFSPALAHRQRVLASLSTSAMLAEHAARAGVAPAMPESGPVASEYHALLASQHDDLRRLHEVQSKDTKATMKAGMIKAYVPWCEGVITGDPQGNAPQDEIVVTTFIWAIDIRDWAFALKLGAYITANGLQLPERFHRGPGGLLVSEIAEVAISEPGSVPHDILLAVASGRGEGPAWDMKNETLARLYRAIGESWARQAESFEPNTDSAVAGGKAMLVDAALTAFREAMRLHTGVGVKKVVEVLEREAKKLAEAAGETPPNDTPAGEGGTPPAGDTTDTKDEAGKDAPPT